MPEFVCIFVWGHVCLWKDVIYIARWVSRGNRDCPMGRIRRKIGRRNIIHVKTEAKAKSRFCASLLRKKLHLTVCGTFFFSSSYNIHISTVHNTTRWRRRFLLRRKKAQKIFLLGLRAEEIPQNHWHSSIVHLSSSRILVVGDPEWKMSLAIKSLIQREKR